METMNELGAGDYRMLQETAETFLQMAIIARSHSPSEEYRVFYSHLAFSCLRLLDCKKAASQVARQILQHLDSLIPSAELQKSRFHIATKQDRLQVLNFHWENLQNLSADAKSNFVLRWLRPSVFAEEREKFENTLEDYLAQLGRQRRPELLSNTQNENQSISIGEPLTTIWKPAQSIYDALLNCKTCSCSHSHHFGAKFQLSTYRQPSKTSAHRTRRRPGDTKHHGDLEFDMFVSKEEEWHEIRVHADRYVKEARDGCDIPPDVAPRSERCLRRKVEKLCSHLEIYPTQSRHIHRLELRLNDDQLFDLGFEKTNFPIARDAEAFSLAKYIQDHPGHFTEKTKRILSVIIGHTVLHLHGTSWLQAGWGSAKIRFFRTKSQKVPLRPFMEIDLRDKAQGDNVFDDDGIYWKHLCPPLISLAVVLMEIHFVETFGRLAAIRGIDLIETPDGRVAFIDAVQVYNGNDDEDDDDSSGQEGMRSEIPGDFHNLIKAIDNCLDAELWEHDDQALDHHTLRSRMYEKVIHPLELHLACGFSEVPLDGIDKYARKIDFLQWGKILPSVQQIRCQDRGMETPPRTPSPAISSSARSLTTRDDTHAVRMGSGKGTFQPVSSSMAKRDATSNFFVTSDRIDSAGGRFFDDMISQRSETYDSWKERYGGVYEKFIAQHVSSYSGSPIKIAILDTGIDEEHALLDAHRGIKGKQNFHDSSHKQSVPDTSGHGTFAANLILDFAPDVDLYVIKVAEDTALPDAKIVQDAIDYAVNKWEVDIISMSFGWPTSNFPGHEGLRDSIDEAYGKHVLMFAAASNNGGNSGRAYPASSPHVICVHSSNTNGKVSDFSPPAEEGTMNFSTVGECVLSVWPGVQNYVSRSGTSYATPILAGISAFLLQYARLHLPMRSSEFSRKENMEALLRRCAERGPRYKSADGYSYIELSLHEHNLFGRKLEEVNYEFLETLKR